ncbi:MAG: hypothetical protein LBD55_03365 [Treponema sp.]|nr:hypothetical protein [Treponema sp.]
MQTDLKEYKLTDALEIHFIDMTRFRRHERKGLENPLHRRLMFLDRETKPDIKKTRIIVKNVVALLSPLNHTSNLDIIIQMNCNGENFPRHTRFVKISV